VQTTGLQLSYAAGRVSQAGLLRVDALSVSSRLSPLSPLGSYRIDMAGGDVTQLTLTTLRGDLQLSGHGQWVGGRLHFAGEAQTRPEREPVLSNLLNILGQREGATRSLISLG
jgi:general secretion pathway protein N